MYQYRASALRERPPTQRYDLSLPFKGATPNIRDLSAATMFFSKGNMFTLAAEIHSIRQENGLPYEPRLRDFVESAAKKWAREVNLQHITAAYAQDQGLLSYLNKLFIKHNPRFYGGQCRTSNVFRQTLLVSGQPKLARELMPEDYGQLDFARADEVSRDDQVFRYCNRFPSWQTSLHHRWHDFQQDGLKTWDPMESSLSAPNKGYDMSRIKKGSFWA